MDHAKRICERENVLPHHACRRAMQNKHGKILFLCIALCKKKKGKKENIFRFRNVKIMQKKSKSYPENTEILLVEPLFLL